MALFINRDERRSQFQEKLAADLKGKLIDQDIKAKKTESAFLEDAHQTRLAGMIIAILLLVLVVAIIVTLFLINK